MYLKQYGAPEMAKSVPLSVRLNDEEAAFLSAYEAPGAVTPSEKMRAILDEARSRQMGITDYAGCAAMMEDLLRPSLSRVRRAQRQADMRSDLVLRLFEKLPELLAELVVATPSDDAGVEQLTKFEAELADQAFALIEEIIDMGLTSRSRTYDPGLIPERMIPILEICALVAQRHNQERTKNDQ
jgi:hypothetical protein